MKFFLFLAEVFYFFLRLSSLQWKHVCKLFNKEIFIEIKIRQNILIDSDLFICQSNSYLKYVSMTSFLCLERFFCLLSGTFFCLAIKGRYIFNLMAWFDKFLLTINANSQNFEKQEFH